jgi:hypothetical protein
MYNNDDNDVSRLAWLLFVKTGAVNYYVLHKKTKSEKQKDLEDLKK